MMYYFIIGILFIDIIIPILENLTSCIITKLEVYKAKYALKITEINNSIEDITSQSETCQSIGFSMPGTEEEYND